MIIVIFILLLSFINFESLCISRKQFLYICFADEIISPKENIRVKEKSKIPPINCVKK